MIDLWIVGIFLFITLVVGIWQGRGIKTIKTYAIADRNYSTAVIVATISATWIGGGSSMGVAEKSFLLGSFFFFILLSEAIAKYLIAMLLAPKIDHFRDCISIGDIMGKMYGPKAKLITGVAGTLAEIAALGAQIGALGQIFNYFMGTSIITGIIIGFGIVLIYSFFGGVKAVTITDILQFVVLIVAVPMICNLGLAKVGGYKALLEALPPEKLTILPPKEKFWQYLNVFLIFSIPTLGPSYAQRLLMTKTGKQASDAYKYTALLAIPFYKMVCITGLVAFVLAPNLDPHFAMPYVIRDILPIGLKGLAICGLLAIVMSSADSILNSSSVLIVHDVIGSLYKKPISDTLQLTLARIFTLVIGILGSFIALHFSSILDIVLLSGFFWKPIAFIGIVFGMTGFRSMKSSYYWGIGAGVLTMALWLTLDLEKKFTIAGTIPSVVINAIFFFGSHYYYKLYKPERFEPIPFLGNSNEPIGGKKNLN